ncbi:MAG: SMC-Scp complex subunit ScpB [Undibacterium sp.]
MTDISHQAGIEALLFISGEPVSYARLMTLLGLEREALETEIALLHARYTKNTESGLMLIEHEDRIEIATKPGVAKLVESLTKSTLQESLSKAALEVLSIIAYRAPIARAEIEAIRGVNCSYTIRALLLRGLVERQGNPSDARGYVYRPTFAFLEHLGLSTATDLPDYASLSTDPRMNIVESEPIEPELTTPTAS